MHFFGFRLACKQHYKYHMQAWCLVKAYVYISSLFSHIIACKTFSWDNFLFSLCPCAKEKKRLPKNRCLSNVWLEVHRRFLILRICICCMNKIEVLFFSQFYDIPHRSEQNVISSFVLKVKTKVIPLLFPKFCCSIYCIFPVTETYC